jgi:hypothetical protein
MFVRAIEQQGNRRSTQEDISLHGIRQLDADGDYGLTVQPWTRFWDTILGLEQAPSGIQWTLPSTSLDNYRHENTSNDGTTTIRCKQAPKGCMVKHLANSMWIELLHGMSPLLPLEARGNSIRQNTEYDSKPTPPIALLPIARRTPSNCILHLALLPTTLLLHVLPVSFSCASFTIPISPY